MTTPVARSNPDRTLLEIFFYLQVLDVMSTLIGFSLGNTEASPFIRLLIRWGPVTGLICSKLFAAACLIVCILLHRWSFIRWINYWYAALVMWNLVIILNVLMSSSAPPLRTDLTPAEVVKTVVTALQHYNSPSPNAGVYTTFRFASPANHAVTGPYGNFLALVKAADFAPLLHIHPWQANAIAIDGDRAVQLVTVHVSHGRDAAFKFSLSLQKDGRYRGRWMVDGVSKEPSPIPGV